MAYFPGRDHFGHRADGLFDGDVGVATMHVPQVDDVDAQTAQRRLACLTHVLGIAPGALRLGVIDGSDTAPVIPNFVARVTSSRRSASRPTSSSLVPAGPVAPTGGVP